MMYTRKASEIVAYTFCADTYCPDCIAIMFNSGSGNAEACLDVAAVSAGVDRSDESSYDSGDFPKVVFSSMVEGPETCGRCFEPID